MGLMNTGETMRSPIGKLFYVAGVTTFCTFLGCWALLAHQETSQSTKKAASDEQFAKKAAQGGLAEVKMDELAQRKERTRRSRSLVNEWRRITPRPAKN
jgi:hypothetical protein